MKLLRLLLRLLVALFVLRVPVGARTMNRDNDVQLEGNSTLEKRFTLEESEDSKNVTLVQRLFNAIEQFFVPRDVYVSLNLSETVPNVKRNNFKIRDSVDLLKRYNKPLSPAVSNMITRPPKIMSGEEYLSLSTTGRQILSAAKLVERHVRSLEEKRKRKLHKNGKSGKRGFKMLNEAIDKLNQLILPVPVENDRYACPAKYKKDVNDTRIPRVIHRAVCKEYRCSIHDLTEDRYCQEVKIRYFTLNRVHGSKKRYEAEEIQVSVACACTLYNTVDMKILTTEATPIRGD